MDSLKFCLTLVLGMRILVACSDPRIRIVGPRENYGRLEVLYDGKWGTVCDDYFSDTAGLVACRSLGYQRGFAVVFSCIPKVTVLMTNGYQGGEEWKDLMLDFAQSTDGIVWLDDIKCRENDTDFFMCSHQPWGYHNCYMYENAGVFCYSTQPTAVRLVNGTDKAGRVEVLVGNTWGSICGAQFTDASATVVCRMLGYTSGFARPNGYYGEGLGFIFMKDVSCTGDEADIFSCTNSGISCQQCGDTHHVGVYCDLRSPIFSNKFLVPLNVVCHPNSSVEVSGLQTGVICFAIQIINDVEIVCNVTVLSATSVQINGCVKDVDIIFSCGSSTNTDLIADESTSNYRITCNEISENGEIRRVTSSLDVRIDAVPQQFEPTYDVTSEVDPSTAVVGTPVMWTIHFPVEYVLQIVSCEAYPGTNNQSGLPVALITNGGCSVTNELISDFYTGSGTAVATILAFKFVNTNSVYLTCDIWVCPNRQGMCNFQGTCSLPPAPVIGKRDVSKRSTHYNTSYSRTVGTILHVTELTDSSSCTITGDVLMVAIGWPVYWVVYNGRRNIIDKF